MSAKEHFKGIEGKWKMESRSGYEVRFLLIQELEKTRVFWSIRPGLEITESWTIIYDHN